MHCGETADGLPGREARMKAAPRPRRAAGTLTLYSSVTSPTRFGERICGPRPELAFGDHVPELTFGDRAPELITSRGV